MNRYINPCRQFQNQGNLILSFFYLGSGWGYRSKTLECQSPTWWLMWFCAHARYLPSSGSSFLIARSMTVPIPLCPISFTCDSLYLLWNIPLLCASPPCRLFPGLSQCRWSFLCCDSLNIVIYTTQNTSLARPISWEDLGQKETIL